MPLPYKREDKDNPPKKYCLLILLVIVYNSPVCSLISRLLTLSLRHSPMTGSCSVITLLMIILPDWRMVGRSSIDQTQTWFLQIFWSSARLTFDRCFIFCSPQDSLAAFPTVVVEHCEVEVWLRGELLDHPPDPLPVLADVGDGHQGGDDGLVWYEGQLGPGYEKGKYDF